MDRREDLTGLNHGPLSRQDGIQTHVILQKVITDRGQLGLLQLRCPSLVAPLLKLEC
jgi:hypothetical protein